MLYETEVTNKSITVTVFTIPKTNTGLCQVQTLILWALRKVGLQCTVINNTVLCKGQTYFSGIQKRYILHRN